MVGEKSHSKACYELNRDHGVGVKLKLKCPLEVDQISDPSVTTSSRGGKNVSDVSIKTMRRRNDANERTASLYIC